jgi:HK97 gp10 family phage protein
MPLQVIWKGDKVKADVQRATEEATGETTQAAVDAAQSLAPVVTGAYRASIRSGQVRSERELVRGSWGAGVRYAIYVEVGSRGRPGRHVLRRSGDMELPQHWRRIRIRL